jgi:hypothetical protein
MRAAVFEQVFRRNAGQSQTALAHEFHGPGRLHRG